MPVTLQPNILKYKSNGTYKDMSAIVTNDMNELIVSNEKRINDIILHDKISVSPTWEIGSINTEGYDTTGNTLYRSVGYTEIIEDTLYTIKVKNGNGLICRLYDTEYIYIDSRSLSATTTTNETTLTFPVNAKYVRFVITRYNTDYTTNPANVLIEHNSPIMKNHAQFYTNREYASTRGYGYLGLTYHWMDNTSDNDGQMIMYLSPDGMEWYKIGIVKDCPIIGKDYSTIYNHGYFYIAYDYTDKTFNNWTTDDDTYIRGGNRIGVLKTNDFVKWEQTWINLDLQWKSTWAPEIFVDGDNFYIILTVSDGSEIAPIWSNDDIKYVKNHVLLLSFGTSISANPTNIYDITPSIIENPNIIDPFIIKKDSTYYLTLKDEKTGLNLIYKSNSLTGTSWTYVTSFVGKVEGISIINDTRRSLYVAYADMRFTNKSGTEYEVARRQYGIAISKDMENWSEFVTINTQGDAPLRHFTPLILNEYSAPRVTKWIADNFKNDSQVDRTISFGTYGLIAAINPNDENPDTTVVCNHYNCFLLKAGAVYRVSGGAVTVDDVSAKFMAPGQSCCFILVDNNSSITFASGVLGDASITLNDKTKMLYVLCTNAENTNTNAFTIRCGTEARGFIVGGYS